MTRTSGGLIHGYSGTSWTVAVLWSRDSYTRVYRGISLWIIHLAKRHVAHPAFKNKRAASPTRLLFATIDCPRPRGCGAIGPTDSHNSIHYAGGPTQEQALRHWPQNVPWRSWVCARAFRFSAPTSRCSPSQPYNHLSNILLRTTWTVWAWSLRNTWRQFSLRQADQFASSSRVTPRFENLTSCEIE